MSDELPLDKYTKKRFYFFFFSIVIIGCIALDFLVAYNLIGELILLIIVIVINLITVIYLIANPEFFKEHALFVLFSFIFMVLPWLLFIKLIYKNGVFISLILDDIPFYIIFLSIIPIIIIDNYLFTKRRGMEFKISSSMKSIKNSFYFCNTLKTKSQIKSSPPF